MNSIKLKQIIREEVRKTLNEGAILKAITPSLQGEVKVAVEALEKELQSTGTMLDYLQADRLAYCIIDIIDAAKQEERDEISQSESVVKEASIVNERPELELGKAIGNIPAGVDRNRSTEFDKKSFDALVKTLKPLNDLEKAAYLAKIVEKLNLNYNAIANLRKKLQELH